MLSIVFFKQICAIEVKKTLKKAVKKTKVLILIKVQLLHQTKRIIQTNNL